MAIPLPPTVAPALFEEFLLKAIDKVAPSATRSAKWMVEEAFHWLGQVGAGAVGEAITPNIAGGAPMGGYPTASPETQAAFARNLMSNGGLPAGLSQITGGGATQAASDAGSSGGIDYKGLFIGIGILAGFVVATHVAAKLLSPTEEQYAKKIAAQKDKQIAVQQLVAELTPQQQKELRQAYESSIDSLLASMKRNHVPTSSVAFMALNIARG